MKVTNKEIKKAYTDILKVCEKYAGLDDGLYSFSDIQDMCIKAENHLMVIEWSEKYDIDLKHDTNLDNRYVRLNNDTNFTYFMDARKDKRERSGYFISWSDDGKQPKNEWLYCIGFSTGAYMFGDDYPQELFERFWNELKTYNPDYIDSHNQSMYFKLENASKIYKEYDGILKKYREINKEDVKKRKIKKMEEELEKLKANT